MPGQCNSSSHHHKITCIISNSAHLSQCSLRKANLMHAVLPALTYCLLSVWEAIDLIKCTKKNKLSENVAGLSLVDMWPIFHHLLSLCNLKHRRRSLPHNAQKCNSAAPRRAGVDLYLDKQIDKQSTLFHYQAEKLTTNANSGSTASVETSKGEEEQNKMNSQFISEQTLTMASYWLRTSWVETILSVF